MQSVDCDRDWSQDMNDSEVDLYCDSIYTVTLVPVRLVHTVTNIAQLGQEYQVHVI